MLFRSVKNYSSGMKARLGFSIATIMDPEILILDEVLSVGDAKFRKKSESRILEMFDKGVTVLFVSHSIEQVRRICNRAIILDKGILVADGPAAEICDLYEEKYIGIENIKPKKKKKKKKKKPENELAETGVEVSKELGIDLNPGSSPDLEQNKEQEEKPEPEQENTQETSQELGQKDTALNEF